MKAFDDWVRDMAINTKQEEAQASLAYLGEEVLYSLDRYGWLVKVPLEHTGREY